MKLSYQAIEENVIKMYSLTEELKDILDNVSNEMIILSSDEVWAGEGSTYVLNQYEKLKDNFNQVYEELERAILFITDVTDGYKYLDEKIQNDILANLNLTAPDYSDSRIFIPLSLDKETNNE